MARNLSGIRANSSSSIFIPQSKPWAVQVHAEAQAVSEAGTSPPFQVVSVGSVNCEWVRVGSHCSVISV